MNKSEYVVLKDRRRAVKRHDFPVSVKGLFPAFSLVENMGLSSLQSGDWLISLKFGQLPMLLLFLNRAHFLAVVAPVYALCGAVNRAHADPR